MAKALKVVGFAIGAVGLGVVTLGLGSSLALSAALASTLGTGIAASTLLIGAAALEVGSSLLAKKTATTTSMTDRLTADVDPRAPRKTCYGRTALAMDIREA